MICKFQAIFEPIHRNLVDSVVVDYVNGNNCQGLFHSKFGEKENDEAIEAMGHLPLCRSTVHQWKVIIGEARYDTVQQRCL